MPACDAVIVTEPVPTIVTVDPLTVATLVFEEEYMTGKLLEATAAKLKDSPKVLDAMGLKVMDCDPNWLPPAETRVTPVALTPPTALTMAYKSLASKANSCGPVAKLALKVGSSFPGIVRSDPLPKLSAQ